MRCLTVLHRRYYEVAALRVEPRPPWRCSSRSLPSQSAAPSRGLAASTLFPGSPRPSSGIKYSPTTRKNPTGEGKIKASSYIVQYPVLRTAQSALHFTSLTDLFTQTPSRLLWEASSHMLQLMREGCSYTYPPLSTARYSFIQLSDLEQCSVNKIAQEHHSTGFEPGL